MNDINYRGCAAEQTLLNCGFSPESISAITSTRVVTHNGTQHVIRENQSHLLQNNQEDSRIIKPKNPAENIISTPRVEKTEVLKDNTEMYTKIISQLTEQHNVQSQQFSRFKQYADNRIMQLESQMSMVLEKLKFAVDTIQTLKSNSEAQSNRARLAQGNDKAPETEAIDRNRVAPADVSIEKIFYFGNT